MGKNYLTSDPHYYHFNCIRYCDRPYTTVEEMNEALVTNWNNTVNPEDKVYILGDFSLAVRPVELYGPRLNGTKLLVPGNHDSCFPAHKKARTVEKKYIMDKFYKDNGLTVLPINITEDLPGLGVVNLSHFPYKGDSTDTRFDNYRLEDNGKLLLCGHVHEKWKTKRTPKGTLMINVGVDVWDYKPVSLEQLIEVVNAEK
jgi:calcineurin-like phosphoesterase family protein